MKASSQQLFLLSEITSEHARSAEGKYENLLTTEARTETSLQRQGYLVEYLLCADTISWLNPVSNPNVILLQINDWRIRESTWLALGQTYTTQVEAGFIYLGTSLFHFTKILGAHWPWLTSLSYDMLTSRYLLKSLRWAEGPVHDRAPGPSLSPAVRRLSFPKNNCKWAWQICSITIHKLRLRHTH